MVTLVDEGGTAETPSAAEYRDVLVSSFRGSYASGRDFWSNEPALRQVVPVLVRHLGDPPAHVLDVGTGRGRDAAVLLEAGHRVTGVDLVEVDEWAELRRRYPDRAAFRAVDVHALGERGSYDAVLDNGCLHHQRPDDYARTLAVYRQALRPGGLLVISLFLTQEAVGLLHLEEDGRRSREFPHDEAVELVTGGGFTIVDEQTILRRRPGLAYLVLVGRAG